MQPTAKPVPLEVIPHLRRAHDHIDRHFADPLDLDLLASIAGMSRHHFVRSFGAVYGEPPMRYATRRRIERAQDLLRSANLTVTEICMLVGYSSLGSFSSRFRELTGESPLEYRERFARDGMPRIPGCYLFMRGASVLDHRVPANEPAVAGAASSNPGEAAEGERSVSSGP
ncbi:MAG: helix-turn-helix domain-containing protein [Microthrixaceae bacterium]